MNRFLLFFLAVHIGCGNPGRPAEETRDTLKVTDSTTQVWPEAPTNNIAKVQVGSDALVDKSTEDTLYYAVLKFQPIAGDFYQLKSMRVHLIDLSDGASKDRLVIQVTTTGRLSPENDVDKAIGNCYSLAEIKEGKTNVLSLVDLDDTQLIHRGFGTLSTFFSIDTLAVKENGSALLVRLQNDGGAEPEKGTIYMMNNDKMVPVMEHHFTPGPTGESGTRGTSTYFLRTFDSYDVILLESSTGGFRDVRIQERSTEEAGTQPPLSVTRGKDCKWDGKKYACEGVMEIKR